MSLPKIQHPTFKFKLPKTKTTVTLRPFIVKEEKILLMAKQGGDRIEIMNAIKQVVGNCVVDKDFNVDEQPLYILEYLYLKLRSISVNNIVQVTYQDNEDGKSRTFDVDLSSIEVKFPEKPVSNIVKITDTVGIELKYPPAEIYSDPKLKNATSDITDVIILSTIAKIFDGDKVYLPSTVTQDELVSFLEGLDVKSYDQIRDYLVGMPVLFHEITYINEKGSERKITLTSLEDFFILP